MFLRDDSEARKLKTGCEAWRDAKEEEAQEVRWAMEFPWGYSQLTELENRWFTDGLPIKNYVFPCVFHSYVGLPDGKPDIDDRCGKNQTMGGNPRKIKSGGFSIC